MLQTIIVDDEPKVCETLEMLLSSYCKDVVNVMGRAHSVNQSFEMIQAYQPDLVLLDIKLEDGSGFDLLEKFEEFPFSVVFITSFNEFAIKAFKYSALDYLLKPVEPQELVDAIEKVRLHTSLIHFRKQFDYLLTQRRDKQEQSKKIILKTADAIHIVNVEDIVRFEASGSYTKIYLNDRQAILVSRHLKEYESLLRDRNFYRIHRGHLVNVGYFDRLERRDGGFMIMKDKSEVPISNQKKEELLQLIAKC